MRSKRALSLAQEDAVRTAHQCGTFGRYVGQRDATGSALQRAGVLRRVRPGSNEFALTAIGQLVAEALAARGALCVDRGGVISGRLPMTPAVPAAVSA